MGGSFQTLARTLAEGDLDCDNCSIKASSTSNLCARFFLSSFSAHADSRLVKSCPSRPPLFIVPFLVVAVASGLACDPPLPASPSGAGSSNGHRLNPHPSTPQYLSLHIFRILSGHLQFIQPIIRPTTAISLPIRRGSFHGCDDHRCPSRQGSIQSTTPPLRSELEAGFQPRQGLVVRTRAWGTNGGIDNEHKSVALFTYPFPFYSRASHPR